MRKPVGGLWGHADFLKLWTGQSISELGSQVSGLAIPLLAALSLHASPFQFSLLGVMGFLPFILFALRAGLWVDRLCRRYILIGGIGNTLAILPIALSSVLKVREMPEPVQEPTPAQAELEGGLLPPHPLPSPATSDA
jgi:uncharacterized protein involved in response to NO